MKNPALTAIKIVFYAIEKVWANNPRGLDVTEEKSFLAVVRDGQIDDLFKKPIRTTEIRIRTALEKVLPHLTGDDREIIMCWAAQHIKHIKLQKENQALHHEHQRYLEWLRERDAAIVGQPIMTGRRSSSQDTNIGTLCAGPTLTISSAAAATTPVARLYHHIGQAKVPWLDDARDRTKAYVFACLSELAYLQLTEHELQERDRYKLFLPSVANAELRRLGISIPLEVFSGPADLPFDVFATLDFVYVTVRLRGTWVVAVRGTHSLGDLLLDLRATQLHVGNGTYHKGFAREALTARVLLRQRITNDWPIYFTGHSMGAAVAAILRQEWNGPNRLMTPYLFAPPRFSGRSTSTRLPTYSYVRPWDIVPHVPPLAFGYAPNSTAPETVPSWRRQHGALLCTLASIDQLFATHSMEGYRAGLGQELGETFDESSYVKLLGEIKRQR